MPVTARLSKAFYERFGEQLTNEIVDWFNSVDATYKSDFRELAESLWTRFDAKLDQRVAELRAEFKTDIATLKADLLKWMFAFWVTNLVAIAGLLLQLRQR